MQATNVKKRCEIRVEIGRTSERMHGQNSYEALTCVKRQHSTHSTKAFSRGRQVQCCSADFQLVHFKLSPPLFCMSVVWLGPLGRSLLVHGQGGPGQAMFANLQNHVSYFLRILDSYQRYEDNISSK